MAMLPNGRSMAFVVREDKVDKFLNIKQPTIQDCIDRREEIKNKVISKRHTTLLELGQDYERQCKDLEDKIAGLRKKEKSAKGETRRLYHRQIVTVEEMRRDLKINADKLLHYYDEE